MFFCFVLFDFVGNVITFRVVNRLNSDVCWWKYFTPDVCYNLITNIVVKATADRTVGLGFQAGEIGHRNANDSPPLRCFCGAVGSWRSAADVGSPLGARFSVVM